WEHGSTTCSEQHFKRKVAYLGWGAVFSTGALSSDCGGACVEGEVTGVLSRRRKTMGALLRRLASARASRSASLPWEFEPATSLTDAPTISWWLAMLTAAPASFPRCAAE